MKIIRAKIRHGKLTHPTDRHEVALPFENADVTIVVHEPADARQADGAIEHTVARALSDGEYELRDFRPGQG